LFKILFLVQKLIIPFACDSRRWVSDMSRPFEVRYNPHTERIEVLDSVHRLDALVSQMNLEMVHLTNAIKKLKAR